MKAITFTLAFLLFSNFIFAQYTLIPDTNFEKQLIYLKYDTIRDGKVLTANISAVTSLSVSSKRIYDLTGIEDFIEIETLSCYSNKLINLDLSKNTKLTSLYCEYSSLNYLDVSKNTNLTFLSCGLNNLSNLDLSKNTELVELWCSGNKISKLDLTKNTKLEKIYCSSNELDTIDLRNNNNSILQKLMTVKNPFLSCIAVDDTIFSNTNWTTSSYIKDNWVKYSDILCEKNIPIFPLTPISEIQYTTNSDGCSPLEDKIITTSGIVTAILKDSNINTFYFQDKDSTWSGICVRNYQQIPALGDNITITATVDENYGQTYLKDVVYYNENSSNNYVPPVFVSTTNEINSECYESVLVQFGSAKCTDDNYGNFIFNDGSGDIIVKAVGDLSDFNFCESCQITGIVISDDFFQDKLIPRNHNDLMYCDYIDGFNSNNIKIYPNPTNEFLFVKNANSEFSKIEIFDIKGSLILTENLVSNEQKINVNSLQKGIYFIHLLNENGEMKTFKMVK